MTTTKKDERVSLTDTINSLTGYEEDEITGRFGNLRDLLDATDGGSVKVYRACLYVLERRKGKDEAAAMDAVQTLSRTAVVGPFLDESEDADDAMPDEPDTEQGKDASASD